ncbi:MAG: CinA family protein [Alphaproteobacteria bacterium]
MTQLLPTELLADARKVIDVCRGAGLKIATVESCTGGLLAGALTSIAGSSEVVERGFVTYSNEAKSEQVGVPGALIDAHGAVSEEVARAMAEGGVAQSRADLAIAITGIAGPDGGTPAKPVGLVHIAGARAGRETLHLARVFSGDRDDVRLASVSAGLGLLLNIAG